jgi:tetratricopeptide (TPR) repeat protein
MNAPREGQGAAQELVERLADEMTGRWRRGERPCAEEYLAACPELAADPEAALELVSEEIRLRLDHGEPVHAAELRRRFPQWEKQVCALLDFHRVLASQTPAAAFPAPSETLGDFELLAEIGRGAYARVYLARQTSLAGRPVVLKVGPRAGQEHLCLARLQHSHIVPLYGVQEFPQNGLRGLCQPYFGGATLADLLRALKAVPPRRRRGQDLVEQLTRLHAGAQVGVAAGGPACNFLRGATYVQAVSWLGACLADALQYASERGLVHLDLKPSNVLLAADGQPMLLDFHLASAPLPAGARPTHLGGTPGYMAPEHQAAVTAVAEGRPLPAALDGRADVFSLGRLLSEVLGGRPEVPRGLAALLARCQAADPALRYARAADLAADLRRHLDDLPLRGVPDGAPLDRWRRWRRRRPYALPLLLLLLGGLGVAAVLAGQHSRQSARADAALKEGFEHLGRQRYRSAAVSFRHGSALAEELALAGSLRHELRQGLALAEAAHLARELHSFCERIRPLYGMEALPAQQARAVVGHCRRFWERSGQVRLCLDHPLDGALREQASTDLLDLAILWAHLAARLAPTAGRQEALAILDQAKEAFGPSCVLELERHRHAVAAGLEAPGQLPAGRQPRGAWEHFALGRFHYQNGEVHSALRAMDRALALDPRALWPTFYRGCCASRLGSHDDAVVAFSICAVLAGEQAWCLHNRGLAYLALGRLDRARQDLDRALALEPRLAAAALTRATLHYREERYDEALLDLRRALDAGLDTPAVRYNLALVHLARQEHGAALRQARRALYHDPGHGPSKRIIEQLQPGG